jgi:ferrochelatase
LSVPRAASPVESSGAAPHAVALLLLNLGTPAAPEPRAVRRYLREFLSDPRVLDLPAWRRFLLRELVLLPRRARRSAAAYRQIWTAAGSPLLVHGRALAEKLGRRLGGAVRVELAMRYGEPSIAGALDRLERAGIDRIALLPLYPQYSSAATGSAVERTLALAAARWNVPSIQVIPPFYDHPAWLDLRAALVRPLLDGAAPPDRVVFSFHGLPERQIRRADRSGRCLARPDCCAALGPENRFCYRAHCCASARALGARLGLDVDRIAVAFQSRLGRAPWLTPATDQALVEAARAGARRVLVAPGFAADCLETLEELAIRGAATFRAAGGAALAVVPAPNADDRAVEAFAAIARDGSSFVAAAGAASGSAHS